MEINIKTKFNIGDNVWALLPRAEVEPYYNWSCLRKWELALYEKEIIAIRYYQSKDEQCIQYFLEGMHCYEGENWFNEPNDTDNINDFWQERIFSNYKEAYKAYNNYRFFETFTDAVDNISNKLQDILDNKDAIIKNMKL